MLCGFAHQWCLYIAWAKAAQLFLVSCNSGRQNVAKDCHGATDLMVLWGMDMMNAMTLGAKLHQTR